MAIVGAPARPSRPFLMTMTPEAFRALALSLPRAKERPILGSQEFRIKDKIFATLGWPQAGWAVIKLAPADQTRFLGLCEGLSPERGGRGKRGVTRVRLAALDPGRLAPVLKAA
jgi:hypothetical protein